MQIFKQGLAIFALIAIFAWVAIGAEVSSSSVAGVSGSYIGAVGQMGYFGHYAKTGKLTITKIENGAYKIGFGSILKSSESIDISQVEFEGPFKSCEKQTLENGVVESKVNIKLNLSHDYGNFLNGHIGGMTGRRWHLILTFHDDQLVSFEANRYDKGVYVEVVDYSLSLQRLEKNQQ